MDLVLHGLPDQGRLFPAIPVWLIFSQPLHGSVGHASVDLIRVQAVNSIRDVVFKECVIVSTLPSLVAAELEKPAKEVNKRKVPQPGGGRGASGGGGGRGRGRGRGRRGDAAEEDEIDEGTGEQEAEGTDGPSVDGASMAKL